MKQIILIDMDNTIVDYSTPIAEAIKNEGNVDAQPNNWFMFTHDKPLRKIQKRTQSRPNFFFDLKPIDGAIECLNILDKIGYDIFIVSSPSVNSDTCHSDKSRWLKEHMGEYWARKLILTKDKTIVSGDYLIDDRENITGIMTPTWKHIIFTQPYNKTTQHELRLNKWNIDDVLALISK